MLKVTVAAALLATLGLACKKDAALAVTAPSTAEIDALWAMAPRGARGGIVASSRAVGMVEDGLAMARGALEKSPELAAIEEQLDGILTGFAGSPTATLADLGLSRAKGTAIFAAQDGEMLAILPVADREKFLGKVGGTKGATPADPDTIGGITCRTLPQGYACAQPAALLDTLGQGTLAAQLKQLGAARGDVELVGVDLSIGDGGQRGSIVQVMQLERGAATLRGSFVGLPPSLVRRFAAAQVKPRAESAQSVSFAVVDLKSLFADAPAALLGPELASILAVIAAPLTVTVPPGGDGFDGRLPLSDGTPAKQLVEQCTSLPGVGANATLANGVCHFPVPEASLDVDLWLDPDGKTLRLGKRGLVGGPMVPITRVGRELANGTWSMAFWGRGTVMGASKMPGVPGEVDPQTALVLRLLSLVNELGLGLRMKGDTLEYVATLRTIFANPDPVIGKLLEVTPSDIAAARAGDKAKAIASAHASAPFAADYKAGQMGLSIPYMMLGTLSAVAIPAFLGAMKEPTPEPPAGEPVP